MTTMNGAGDGGNRGYGNLGVELPNAAYRVANTSFSGGEIILTVIRIITTTYWLMMRLYLPAGRAGNVKVMEVSETDLIVAS